MKFTIPKELKSKWTEALRSGEYKQGEHFLYDDTNNSYCCLGVLCDIAGLPEDGMAYREVPDGDFYKDNNIELGGGWSILEGGYRKSAEYKLTMMNDGEEGFDKKTFPEIAEWIEENIEGI